MKKILIATSNSGKRKEILSALLPLPDFEILTPADLGLALDIEENGKNYAENALMKAKAYFEKTGLPTIAEDSGMEVSALKGELGMHTRRWGAGPKANDTEWLDFFMKRMAGEKDRSARFVCHAVYLDEKGPQDFEGECLGTITQQIEGPVLPGIPLSAVFKPLHEHLVYSAMGEEQKNALSHRGKAIRLLKNFLEGERKNIAVFIDAGNLWNNYKSIGKLFDMNVLPKFFADQHHGQIYKIFYYVASPQESSQRTKSDIDQHHKFLTFLKKRLHFYIITKPLKIIFLKDQKGNYVVDPITGERQSIEKGNFDVELTIDALQHSAFYDIAVFLTGDSDFLPLVSFLRHQKKKVYVYSTDNCISRELRTGADAYFDLSQFPMLHGNPLKTKKRPTASTMGPRVL